MSKPHSFSERGARRIVGAVRKIEGPPDSGRVPSNNDAVRGGFQMFVKVSAFSEADSPHRNRWTYTVTQVYKTEAGYDGWTEATAGNGVVAAEAFNTVEVMNTAGGTPPSIQGNGIDIDGTAFPAGFVMKPAPVGVIVPAWMVYVGNGEDQVAEVWFNHENAVDGTCAAPE